MLLQRPQFSMILLASLICVGIGPAHARARRAVSPPPQISSIAVNPPNQLTPGSELTITMAGTPHGVASVHIGSVAKTIALPEVDTGIYEGTYTVSTRDHLSPTDALKALLRVRGRSATLTQALTAQAANGAAPAPAAAPPATVAASASAAAAASIPTVIDKFTVKPINKIEPGAELKFTVSGTPRAKATFSIEEVAKDVAMVETQPGLYEGAYTIRRLDNFPSAINITATLDANGQAVRSRLTQSLLIDGKPPVVKNVSPRDGETVITNPVLISATFDDAGGVGIDTKSVRVLVGGVDVTRNAGVTPQFFSYRADLKPGPYAVDISARDVAGKTLHHVWSFTVASAAAPAPLALPLQIVSHANNAQVGAGAVEVKGRTGPDAKVDVQVQAIASIAGFFGLSQQIYAQTLKADANGNFAFTFQPQVTVPGTRYEISIAASKGEMTKDTKLVLFQQR